jgi:hypothetical protein
MSEIYSVSATVRTVFRYQNGREEIKQDKFESVLVDGIVELESAVTSMLDIVRQGNFAGVQITIESQNPFLPEIDKVVGKGPLVADNEDARIEAAEAGAPRVDDAELPGMWESADFMGGQEDVTPEGRAQTPDIGEDALRAERLAGAWSNKPCTKCGHLPPCQCPGNPFGETEEPAMGPEQIHREGWGA